MQTSAVVDACVSVADQAIIALVGRIAHGAGFAWTESAGWDVGEEIAEGGELAPGGRSRSGAEVSAGPARGAEPTRHRRASAISPPRPPLRRANDDGRRSCGRCAAHAAMVELVGQRAGRRISRGRVGGHRLGADRDQAPSGIETAGAGLRVIVEPRRSWPAHRAGVRGAARRRSRPGCRRRSVRRPAGSAQGLLGAHVGRRADDRAFASQVGLKVRPAGQAEIDQSRPPLVVDEHVAPA